MDPQRPSTFLATAARGTEPLLVAELRALGVDDPIEVPGGVRFDGPLRLGMRACLWLRTANRLLLQLAHAEVQHENDVYDAVRACKLQSWFHPDRTLAVNSHVNDPRFRNSHFLSQRIKDAVVDDVRDACGRRPSVDTHAPDVEVYAYVMSGELFLYLGLHGAPLFARGYRQVQGPAPIKETLAASLLLFSGWDATVPLCDPMCGSGTIAIEAALIATNTAPGLTRAFGFERWPGHDAPLAKALQSLRDEALSRRRRTRARISGSDYEARAIEASRQNAVAAGVTDLVFFMQADARSFEPLQPPGAIVVNPPYGERLGQQPGVVKLHEAFGERLRRVGGGHTLTIISTPALLKRALHMKPDARVRVHNGPLECELARYAIRARA